MLQDSQFLHRSRRILLDIHQHLAKVRTDSEYPASLERNKVIVHHCVSCKTHHLSAQPPLLNIEAVLVSLSRWKALRRPRRPLGTRNATFRFWRQHLGHVAWLSSLGVFYICSFGGAVRESDVKVLSPRESPGPKHAVPVSKRQPCTRVFPDFIQPIKRNILQRLREPEIM